MDYKQACKLIGSPITDSKNRVIQHAKNRERHFTVSTPLKLKVAVRLIIGSDE